MPIRLGHHTGELAIDIGPLGELSDVVLPRRKTMFSNARFGDMIENKNLIWMPIYKLDRLGKMLFKDQDVISEIEVSKLSNAAIEIVSQHKLVIRLIVNRMSYSFHFRESSDSFEFGRSAGNGERRPSDDSANQVA